MKYEVILKARGSASCPLEQVGKIIVKPDYLLQQIADYKKKAFRNKYYDSVVLVNELTDSGEFVGVYM